MENLKTTIGLEIHVQLKTKSKMFCRCDNNAEGKAPNTVVCPVCLGMPGSLPVANKQAIEWTIKTGLALNCQIPEIAKFDRKHYFYPDLPKGYQISQYDEPFCLGGYVELPENVIPDLIGNPENKELDPRVKPEDDSLVRINLTRIHLEEDAGKLIHRDGKSLVDLNRAGTPLMEIVTEPDITSPKMAGDFLRKLQKIVRDQVEVSFADMEKGHLRCDANISLREMQDTNIKKQSPKMSPIIEIKNINSFRFVEKALILVEEKLKEEYAEWPENKTKETWGYDSVNNKVYLQRRKEEAADYRYFPEPDLPPFDATKLDLEVLKSAILATPEEKLDELLNLSLAEADAKVLISNAAKDNTFRRIMDFIETKHSATLGRAIVHNYFPFDFDSSDWSRSEEYAKAIESLSEGHIQKAQFTQIARAIKSGRTFDDATAEVVSDSVRELESIVNSVISSNTRELERYKSGEKQLFGFFMGLVMKETNNSANPEVVSRILKEKLEV